MGHGLARLAFPAARVVLRERVVRVRSGGPARLPRLRRGPVCLSCTPSGMADRNSLGAFVVLAGSPRAKREFSWSPRAPGIGGGRRQGQVLQETRVSSGGRARSIGRKTALGPSLRLPASGEALG